MIEWEVIEALRANGFGLHLYTYGKSNAWKIELIDWKNVQHVDSAWDNEDKSDTLTALLALAYTYARSVRKEWNESVPV